MRAKNQRARRKGKPSPIAHAFKAGGKAHSNLALVINFSGGKDSSWMLSELCRRYPLLPKYAVFSDTGFEHEKPISAEEFGRRVCASLGVPFFVVRPQFKSGERKTYLEMVDRRGRFPSKSCRQCTSDLKRDPIAKWIRRQSAPGGLLAGKVVINCLGLRAQESEDRAAKHRLCRNRRLSKAGRLVWDWLPIHRALLSEVLDGLEAANIPLHPVYSFRGNGGYLERLSCRVCIFCSNRDLCRIFEHDRPAFDAVSALEQKLGFTMRNGESLLDIIAKHGPRAVEALNAAELEAMPG